MTSIAWRSRPDRVMRMRSNTEALINTETTHSETSTIAADAIDNRKRIKAIIASSSGNLVEWYDFYIYSFGALYFASAFFPKGDRTTQLLSAASVFAVGFLMRPVGSWIFGRLADRKGRKASMVTS